MRIGIDVGGTKIEGIAIGLTGETLFRERISTPVGDYPGTLKSVAALVRKIEEQTGQSGTIGVGIPGAISPDTGLVKNANSTCLIGERLDADLRDILDRDIRVANDADCFALSEAIDGAGADYASVFGVILGTGVGGGLVSELLLPGAFAVLALAQGAVQDGVDVRRTSMPASRSTWLPPEACGCGSDSA